MEALGEPPVKCTPFSINGVRGFACGPSRYTPGCCKCRTSPARLLCDWKLPSGRTCSKPICERCTTKPAPEKDLCPEHAKAWAEHPRNKPKGKANG